jgi:2-methylcitrate dehydratase PrpD
VVRTTFTLAEELGRFAAELEFDDLSDQVVRSVQDHLCDTLGVAAAALGRSEAGWAAFTFAQRSGGAQEATVLGSDVRVPAANAALVNGTYAHALDFDDTHLPTIVHPSAAMVPALIAEAEAVGASGRDLITALAVAYEVNCRLSLAQFSVELGNSVMFEHGLHATAIIGAVAGAVGCARLRRMDASGITHSLAIACSMGAGLTEANRRGGSIKQLQVGWAGHAAVSAASMAAFGLTGPKTALEGRFGFFEAYCHEAWDPARVTDGLGRVWLTPSISFKPYPCNHFTHAVVDAAIDLKERGLSPSDVARVTIGTAEPSWRTIGDPIEEKRDPNTTYAAKFSAPFVFATALVGGSDLGVGMDDFSEEALADPLRLRIARVCDVVVDAECTRIFPNEFPAVVEVTTHSGEHIKSRILGSRGGPSRPLSAGELATKLRATAGKCARPLSMAVEALPTARAVDRLISSAVGSGAAAVGSDRRD